jgi:hypothetical protein
MKAKFIILICFAITFISSCKDDSVMNGIQFDSTGTIMGSDKGLCPCCGGWILKIDNDDKIYRIEKLPESSGIQLSENTISVKFNWNIDRECSSIIYINIEDIELN